MYYHGVKQESGPSDNSFVKDNDVDVNNFSGEGHVMRSGRVLSLPNVQSNADALAKAKGKQVMVDGQRSEQTNGPKPLVAPDVSSTPEAEVEELMRLIRRSDYNIVE